MCSNMLKCNSWQDLSFLCVVWVWRFKLYTKWMKNAIFLCKKLKNSPLNTKELFMILSYLKHSHRAQRFGTKKVNIA